MNVHLNARMTVRGRVLLVKRIVEGRWRVALAAEAAGVSVRTAYKWLARYRAGGEAVLTDKSSAPLRLPHAKPAATVAAIEALRRQRMSGPAIARHLALPRSTVGVILRRLGLCRIQALETRSPVTGAAKATIAASAGNACMCPSTTLHALPTPKCWLTRRKKRPAPHRSRH